MISSGIFLHRIYGAESKIYRNLAEPHSKKCSLSKVRAGGANLLLIPGSTIASIADTILGTLASCATIVTFGIHKPTVRFAIRNLTSSKYIISKPYLFLLRTFNPAIELKNNEHITFTGDGLITDQATNFLQAKFLDYAKSKKFFKRNVYTRFTLVVCAIAAVITRVADGVIGTLALILTVFTPFLSEVPKRCIINAAYRGLQAPGVISDLFICTIGLINPTI